ncbi:tyrosine-type recombinase/integrase [Nitrogeniibacter aestuarii]|uniref:tyrosine-type recombinase/integrase n=1 Tax=Nitrogeniibacter aestuarii TaxID=2815343 RepID=UPI001D119BF8|nr:integrase arm-type DNA-binding domain-containing protein [Nitrogeniibacter aestuarii]
MGKLTDKFIKATKGEAKDRFYGDGGGLYLRVTPAGSRVWVYRYKNSTGKTRWLDLGAYPSRSLAEARAEAATLKLKRREGIDPAEERQQHEDAARKAAEGAQAELAAHQNRMTVTALFERWMTLEVSKRRDQGKEMRRMFDKDVLPKIGDMAIEDIKKAHVGAIIDDVLIRGGKGRMAALALAGIRQMFRFAVERDFLDGDPTATIRKSRIHKPHERDRVLSSDELRMLVRKLPTAGMCESSQLAMHAMLVTCCRVGELANARLEHVDLDKGTWRIPSENSKNKREHTVFLSDFAIEIFTQLKERAEALGSAWLMPARNKPGPVCSKSLAKQTGDRQRLGMPAMRGRTPNVDALVLPGGKWTPHDLRRTGATIMGDLGVRPDVIERCLNHTEQNRLVRIYQRSTYTEEMRAAWQALGTHLRALMSPDMGNARNAGK